MSAKSNVPWSVKGIDHDARSVAKELARRRGMTLGEFITEMIREKGLDEAHDDTPDAAGQEKIVSGVTTDQLRGVVDTLNRLNERLKTAEKALQTGEVQSREAMGGLNRGLETVFERVKRLERETENLSAPEGLAERLDRLEGANEKNSWVKSLVALERALSTLVEQVESAREDTDSRLEANENLIEELKRRLDAEDDQLRGELSGLTEAIDGTTQRVTETESLVKEALELARAASESQDPTFIDRTSQRLQLLGSEIKRTSDHIRTLEGSVARLSDKIELGEQRSAEGISRVAQSLESLRQECSGLSAGESAHGTPAAMKQAVDDAADRVDALQGAFSAVIDRLEGRINAEPQSTDVTTVSAEPIGGPSAILADFAEAEAAEDEFDRAFEDPLGFSLGTPPQPPAEKTADTRPAEPSDPLPSLDAQDEPPQPEKSGGLQSRDDERSAAAGFFSTKDEPAPETSAFRSEPEPALREEPASYEWDEGPRFDAFERDDDFEGRFRSGEDDPFAPDRPSFTERFSRMVRGLVAEPQDNNNTLAWLLIGAVVVVIGLTALRLTGGEVADPVIVEPMDRRVATASAAPAQQAAPSSEASLPQASRLYTDAKQQLATATDPTEITAGMAMLVRAAEAGSVLAMHDLGEAYLTGDGVIENGTTARRWFTEAAEGGHLRAIHRVAYLDANGIGGPVNVEAALEGFRRSAEAGLTAAMFNLGTLFDPDNTYLPEERRDLEESYLWYALAGRRGDRAAQDKADLLAARLTPDQRTGLDQQVRDFAPTPLQP
jgi:localization factor PodJL